MTSFNGHYNAVKPPSFFLAPTAVVTATAAFEGESGVVTAYWCLDEVRFLKLSMDHMKWS